MHQDRAIQEVLHPCRQQADKLCLADCTASWSYETWGLFIYVIYNYLCVVSHFIIFPLTMALFIDSTGYFFLYRLHCLSLSGPQCFCILDVICLCVMSVHHVFIVLIILTLLCVI